MTAVEWLEENLLFEPWAEEHFEYNKECWDKAKEMEKEQRGYSEEDVRLAYFQGEKDSYIKGGQTKEMENEFIQSLQKHELNKLDILLCGEFIQDPTTTYSKCMCGRYFWEHPTKKSNL